MTASPPAAPNGLPLDLPMGFPAGPAPVISVVVPMRNEGPNVAPLAAEIAAALAGVPHEILCVDDGSSDDTAARIDAAAASGLAVRRLSHARSCGQSAGVVTGVPGWVVSVSGWAPGLGVTVTATVVSSHTVPLGAARQT